MDISIRTIEDRLFRAWPALTTRYYDGWLLRFANGYTRRSHSVNPVYESSLDIKHKIIHCETLYAQEGLPTNFRLTDASLPEDLGAILAQRGYTLKTPTSVQILDLAQTEPPLDPDLRIDSHLTDRWFAAFTRMNESNPRYLFTMRYMLELISLPVCFILLEQAGETAAAGLAVYDTGYVGLFQIVTDACLRRRGLGTALVNGLLHWGKSEGAEIAHLQVVPENTPAMKMYEKMGFREIYQYRYWEKPAPKG